MRVLRFLAVPLLTSMWVAPGLAQYRLTQPAQLPQGQSPLTTPLPFAFHPLPGTHSFSLDFGQGTSAAKASFNPAKPSLNLRRYNLFAPRPDSDVLFQLARLRSQSTVIMAHNDVCYTVREYTFAQDNPESDATRMKDYYACRPASNFHMKNMTPAP